MESLGRAWRKLTRRDASATDQSAADDIANSPEANETAAKVSDDERGASPRCATHTRPSAPSRSIDDESSEASPKRPGRTCPGGARHFPATFVP